MLAISDRRLTIGNWRLTIIVGFSLATLFLLLSVLHAQDIRARAEAYPLSCFIGDPIRYKVTVFAPEQTKVIFPTVQKFGEFGILRPYPIQHQRGELGTATIIAEWDIAVYRLGKVTIPPLELACELEGRRALVRTNPVDIEVIPITKPTDKDPRPLKPPLPYPLSPLAMAILLVGSLFMMAMLWLIGRGMLWALQTAWSSFQKAVTKPPLPPHQLALQTIDRAEQLYRQGEVERAFVLLSFGLRRYLRDRFQVAALELPTWAISQHLQPHLSSEPLTILRFTLDLSDLIKFARYTPTDAEAQKLFTNARQLIYATHTVGAESHPPAAA